MMKKLRSAHLEYPTGKENSIRGEHTVESSLSKVLSASPFQTNLVHFLKLLLTVTVHIDLVLFLNLP